MLSFFMHRPTYGSLPLRRHAGRAASRGEKHSPTRLTIEDSRSEDSILTGKSGLGCILSLVRKEAIIKENGQQR